MTTSEVDGYKDVPILEQRLEKVVPRRRVLDREQHTDKEEIH